ncbi:MAG: HEPN domain-containing protein [Magnetococcus sp. YQC-5]
MDINKHISYWCIGSEEDWEMAEIAMEKGKIRHSLFFTHSAMEKLIKAHVMRVTGDLPPKIHNLLILMKRANLPIEQNINEWLTELNSYCLEGRYTDQAIPPPSLQKAVKIMQQAQELRTWLLNQL